MHPLAQRGEFQLAALQFVRRPRPAHKTGSPYSGREHQPVYFGFSGRSLSLRNAATVARAIKSGIATAMVYAESRVVGFDQDSIRIALDGDGVVFSSEAEKIYHEKRIEAFDTHERKNANVALPEGPMANFLKKLSRLQRRLGEHGHLLKTALSNSARAPRA